MPAYKKTGAEIELMLDSITEERAGELIQQIKPLVRNVDGVLCEIEIPDLFKTAFTWGPTFTKVCEDKLAVVGAIHTYHRCGYHMFFKPSIAEVFAQIPEYLIDDVQSFETLFSDELIEIIEGGGFYGHGTTTILYRRWE